MQDNFAQQSVLGSMLIDSDCVGDVMAELTAEDFDDGALRQLFTAIQAAFASGKPIDSIMLVDEMGRGSDTAFRSFVTQLVDTTPTAANVMEYVKIVSKQNRLSRLQALGMQLAGARDADNAAELVTKINEVSVSRQRSRGRNMNTLLTAFYERHGNQDAMKIIPFGFAELDAGLRVEPGDFLILGGYPSDGKTALALQIAFQQAQSLNVGFFSCETSADKLFDRLAAQVTKTPLSKIKQQSLSEDDWKQLISYHDSVLAHKLEVVESAGWSAADIASYSRARRFDVVFIDYLQLLSAPGKNRFEAVTSISIALHTFAQQSKTVVVALSQLSREAKGNDRTERPPRLSDLRESGQIEQDADAVLLLYRTDADRLNSDRVLRLVKNKEGGLADFQMNFCGKFQRFSMGGIS